MADEIESAAEPSEPLAPFVSPGGLFELDQVDAIVDYLRVWARDPAQARAAFAELRAAVAALQAVPPAQRLDRQSLLEHASRLFLRGDLGLAVDREIGRAIFGGAGTPAEVKEAEEEFVPYQPVAPAAARRATGWIGIELVDDEDVPFEGRAYRLELADGSTREGNLDRHGRARVDGIPQGTCKVFFPGLDFTPSGGAEAAATSEPADEPEAAAIRTAGLAIPAAAFAFDSAFPGPGIWLHLARIEDRAQSTPNRRLAVFGHADKTGTPEYNKSLSDRRAKAVLALLTRDLESFDSLAGDEDWALKQYQAMLRGLGCNPGAIDGDDGPMTRAAVRCFQAEYNENVYHQGSATRAHPDLEVDGVLGPLTKAALRDAYLALSPGNLGAAPLAAHGFSGCSEFNPRSDVDEENRRVVVALLEPSTPADADFPCVEGDASACTLDRPDGMRCKFYRRFIEEPADEAAFPRLFDFQWLREEGGEAHLSALTSLPDGTQARFTIYRWSGPLPSPPPDSSAGTARPEGSEVLGTVEGHIVGGVCHARWTPPEGFDPFDFRSWLVDLDLDIEIDDDADEEDLPDDAAGSGKSLLATEGMRPPVFAIDAGDHWGYSGPPAARLNRVHFLDEPAAEGLALKPDGTVVKYAASSGKVEAEDTEGVLALFIHGRTIPDEEPPTSGEDSAIG